MASHHHHNNSNSSLNALAVIQTLQINTKRSRTFPYPNYVHFVTRISIISKHPAATPLSVYRAVADTLTTWLFSSAEPPAPAASALSASTAVLASDADSTGSSTGCWGATVWCGGAWRSLLAVGSVWLGAGAGAGEEAKEEGDVAGVDLVR
jgi:hypothetical protein